MTEEDRIREISSLLDRYGLKTHDNVLEEKGVDLNALSLVLLRAFLETCDEMFFEHFYELTCRVFENRARSFLGPNAESTPGPEDIAAETYSILLNRYLGGSLAEGEKPLYVGLGIVKNLVHEHGRRARKEAALRPAGAAGFSPGLLDALVEMEEDRRSELLLFSVHELAWGGLSDLTAREKDVLAEFYLGGSSVSDVARKLDMSIENLYKLLNRTRKKVEGLLTSFSRTAEGGEAK